MKGTKKRRLAGAIAVVAVVAMCVLMLCSYLDSPDIPPDNDENGIAQPSERFIEQIEEDYRDYRESDDQNEVYISQYYGVYNGNCVPLVIGLRGDGFFCQLVNQEIAGSNFWFADTSEVIIVWIDGEFFTLEEAYEKGYLTAEQIADIARICAYGEYLVIDDPSASNSVPVTDGTDSPDTTFIYEEPVPCVTES